MGIIGMSHRAIVLLEENSPVKQTRAHLLSIFGEDELNDVVCEYGDVLKYPDTMFIYGGGITVDSVSKHFPNGTLFLRAYFDTVGQLIATATNKTVFQIPPGSSDANDETWHLVKSLAQGFIYQEAAPMVDYGSFRKCTLSIVGNDSLNQHGANDDQKPVYKKLGIEPYTRDAVGTAPYILDVSYSSDTSKCVVFCSSTRDVGLREMMAFDFGLDMSDDLINRHVVNYCKSVVSDFTWKVKETYRNNSAMRKAVVVDPNTYTFTRWGRSDYLAMYTTFVSQYANRVHFMTGWQFSVACIYDFASVLLSGRNIDMFSEDSDGVLHPLSIMSGLVKLREAITFLESRVIKSKRHYVIVQDALEHLRSVIGVLHQHGFSVIENEGGHVAF